jgi:DNA-binding NtrC family response regulator
MKARGHAHQMYFSPTLQPLVDCHCGSRMIPRSRVADRVQRAARADCTILIAGETGSGKEVWARWIHHCGMRADRPFVPVNCAALTPTLAESQLFGHEKGAFTGGSLCRFPPADGGVVFLDAWGDASGFAAKLLRVFAAARGDSGGASTPIDRRCSDHCGRNTTWKSVENRFLGPVFRLSHVSWYPALRDRGRHSGLCGLLLRPIC